MKQSKSSSYKKRIIWLGIAVVIVCALYTAGWFYAASRLESKFDEVIASQQEKGNRIKCDQQRVEGFPYRIGLYCNEIEVRQADGRHISTGALRSTAVIYNPGKIIAELDSPVVVSTADSGKQLHANWTSGRASAVLGVSGPKRSSVEIKEGQLGGLGQTVLAFDNAQMHMRVLQRDLDLALSINSLRSGANGNGRINVEGQVQIAEGAALAVWGQKFPEALRGQRGHIQKLTILGTGADSQLSVSGPFQFDAKGLLTAELQLQTRDLASLLDTLTRDVPQLSNAVNSIRPVMGVLAGQTSLTIVVKQGRARLGFIPLFEVPPI